MLVKAILVLITLVNHAINADTLDFESCGKVVPNLRHYIYGGKSTMIEQWPWQVAIKLWHFVFRHLFYLHLKKKSFT